MAVTTFKWSLLDGEQSFWALLALTGTGHFPRTPFFEHMYPKLKALGRLRGISKQDLFDNLSLGHVERLKSQLNTDELLTLAIQVSMPCYQQGHVLTLEQYEANEWLYNHPWLAKSMPEKKTVAQADAEQKEPDGSPTASEGTTEGTSEGRHTGFTPPPAAGATGGGDTVPGHDGRALEGQGGGARKREGAPSPDERQSKKRRLMVSVEEEEAEPSLEREVAKPQNLCTVKQQRQSIFISDDDSDVL